MLYLEINESIFYLYAKAAIGTFVLAQTKTSFEWALKLKHFHGLFISQSNSTSQRVTTIANFAQ